MAFKKKSKLVLTESATYMLTVVRSRGGGGGGGGSAPGYLNFYNLYDY